MRILLLTLIVCLALESARALDPNEAVLFIDFAEINKHVTFQQGIEVTITKSGASLEFKTHRHELEIPLS
jgi:hypothetical protein